LLETSLPSGKEASIYSEGSSRNCRWNRLDVGQNTRGGASRGLIATAWISCWFCMYVLGDLQMLKGVLYAKITNLISHF